MQRQDDTSRMSGDVHVRFCERLEGGSSGRLDLSAPSRIDAKHGPSIRFLKSPVREIQTAIEILESVSFRSVRRRYR